jgi:hypothetical protein
MLPINFDDYQQMVCDKYPSARDSCQPEYPSTEGFGYIVDISCYDGHCRVDALRVENSAYYE